jgi:S-adenosylmethionine-diacylglycerol 3-amino-3-carboxypropyl transferase
LSLTKFLADNPGEYTHFVLLDHQNWLAHRAAEALEQERRQILSNSRQGTKILTRSASSVLTFLPGFVRDALRFFPERTTRLHLRDRVGTYASTHLAEVV